MKLSKLTVKNYRSIHDASIELTDLTLFIGANASGKSAILDALRFLSEAIHARDFRVPVYSRGGFLNLAWKGQEAHQIELVVELKDKDERFEWSVQLIRQASGFSVHEQLQVPRPGSPPGQLLNAAEGEGWWWSGEKGDRVKLKQPTTTCALAAAAADASFPARRVAEFVGRRGFFDPSPFLLRRDWNLPDLTSFDPYGRNLGETLYALKTSSPEVFDKIVEATRSIVGLPTSIEPRESEERFYFGPGRTGAHFFREPNGRIKRHVAYARADDRPARATRHSADRYRGARELHPPVRVVLARRTYTGCARTCPVHGDHPFASAS